MEPMEGHGIQAMSVGFLIEADTPMVWRGPMVTQALEQLLTETQAGATSTTSWSTFRPGTGDIQLTLAQKVPVTGAVIVTTPQDIALIDARKGLKMFEKVGVPILGIVENMAIHVCSKCGHAEHIFGAGRRRAHVQGLRRRVPRRAAARHRHPRAGRQRQAHGGGRSRTAGSPRSTATSPARWPRASRKQAEDRTVGLPEDRRPEHLIAGRPSAPHEHQERQVDPPHGGRATA